MTKTLKKLLIVESPAKMKTISKYLGPDFTIASTLGHIKDLPSKGMGITMTPPSADHPQGEFELIYEPLEGKQKVITDLRKKAAGVDVIYLAPDPDREGEIIAWHVAQELEPAVSKQRKNVAFYRISFNEITKDAITKSIQDPHAIDMDKVQAQQARRILDRIVGYEVSPVLWKKIAPGLSAGRVQSVALKLICQREAEIRAFTPQEYWSIHALFTKDTDSCAAELTHVKGKKVAIEKEKAANDLLKKVAQGQYTVTADKHTQRNRNPAAPFITSTLQQAAYNSLGMSVQKTMQIAQKLYEGITLEGSPDPIALITYMRTDSTRISQDAVKQARTYITDVFGKEYLPTKAPVYSKSKGQDAHEAIRPISVMVTPEQIKRSVGKDEAALYELIWKRFVACQMPAATYAQRTLTIADIAQDIEFKATGSTLVFDGYLRVYGQFDEDEEKGTSKQETIPASFTQDTVVQLQNSTPKQHFTQAPARYTQASLVKQLEKEGIGRPSTYATIMNTIQARSYTTLDEKKRFVPTDLGMAVTKLLNENLPHIMDIAFTARMEVELDQIAQGERKRDDVIFDFYKIFGQELAQLAGETATNIPETTTITCPECKKNQLAVRLGKSGSFLGCLGYPECTFTSNFTRADDGSISLTEPTKPELLDVECPNCHKPLRKIVGRYGPFIACSGYPECKYIHQERASFPCPSCGKAIIKRTWKGKVFWGCSGYPKCTFSISGDIEEIPCTKCNTTPYQLKKILTDGTTVLTCPNKECS